MSPHLKNQIGAVILAAGGSSRFGRPKQLIPLGGESLIRRIIDAACEARCSPVVVVTGSDIEKVHREIDRASVVRMQNKQWHRGIGSSIRCGIRGLIKNSPDVEASVLFVCDQPAVDARVIERLIALRETTRKSIIASSYADTLGVPALLTVRFFRNCFHSMIKPARNRSFREIGIGLRSLRSHKAKLISIPGKIGKNSIDGASLNEVKDLHKLINCAV